MSSPTRRGVIAMLATIAGAVQAEERAKMVTLPDQMPLRVQLGKGDSLHSPGFDPIIVKLGNETVILTAREIMDALLPPKPNHCPVCGRWADSHAREWLSWKSDDGKTVRAVVECPRCRILFGRD